MRKYLFIFLNFVFIFSTLCAQGDREPRPHHGYMLETQVLETKEIKRTIEYRYPVEWWDPPSNSGYRIEIDYELVVDDQETIHISLWPYNLDEASAQSIYNNYYISPGDILYFDSIHYIGNDITLFDVQIDSSEVILPGSSASKDYFLKKIFGN